MNEKKNAICQSKCHNVAVKPICQQIKINLGFVQKLTRGLSEFIFWSEGDLAVLSKILSKTHESVDLPAPLLTRVD